MAQGRSTEIILTIKWIRTSRLSIADSLWPHERNAGLVQLQNTQMCEGVFTAHAARPITAPRALDRAVPWIACVVPGMGTTRQHHRVQAVLLTLTRLRSFAFTDKYILREAAQTVFVQLLSRLYPSVSVRACAVPLHHYIHMRFIGHQNPRVLGVADEWLQGYLAHEKTPPRLGPP